MATTPVTTPAKFDWHSLIPIFEMAGNIALVASGVGAPFVPLANAVETALNPLLTTLGSGQKVDVTNEVMLAYGVGIATLTAMKQTTGIDPALLTKIEGYIIAAENASAAYIKAGQGFDPTTFAPVTPIA